MNIFHDKIIDLKPSNVFLTIKQCELQNSKQERRYEIRRASTLIGGETKYQINPTTYRFKSLVLSIYSIFFFFFVRSTCPPLLCQVSTFSYLDLPFAMFSHQYESKAIQFYYSMSTISYTLWFPYQFKMTLIECSRILKDRSLVEATRVGPP